MDNIHYIIAAKARALHVPIEAIKQIIANKLVAGEVEMDDDEVSVVLSITPDDLNALNNY